MLLTQFLCKLSSLEGTKSSFSEVSLKYNSKGSNPAATLKQKVVDILGFISNG
jgi:hypothetical protein